ncbi:MAG: histidinol dehydrogenase [Candidatus Rokubacteria bacterium RIFCSPLOWO2_12_FULL_69_21]|nr:MAG: histidinol dehydrogenase [Candidatus Rokubacteria bacterium RIFCSPLOWO2_12_FULL_69_21]
MTCRRLDTRALGVSGVVRALERSPADVDPEIHGRVEAILSAVRARGDAALLEFTERFDGARLQAPELAVTAEEYDAAERAVGANTLGALQYAARRIEEFHRHGLPRSWWVEDANGSRLGQQVRPLDRVGIYVPGGRAAYPSTVLMTAVPARVAGVPEIVLVSPPSQDKSLNAAVLAAARVAGVTEAYRVGGAQAIAALAYGTDTIRRVDKIVGPGNIYVALAKSKVFGQVGIDMVAGPSEVLVVADETADPQWVAADLLAQAEHDPMARAVLLTPVAGLLEGVAAALDKRLVGLERGAVAAKALENNGALVLTRDLDEAVAIANALAPEHLELQVGDPFALLSQVRHAGAIFLGRHTPEVIGDYVAGPNHVLPTGGTARFSSALGVEDFVKRSSLIHYSAKGLREARPHVDALARVEGLQGHGAAAEVRLSERGHPS